MRRRDLFLTPLALAAQLKPREWVTAAASRDTAPRVGLIPSNFGGLLESDGKEIRGLAKPAPLDAPLNAAQLEDMLQLAVELGGGRRGGLVTAIDRDDWVLIKFAANTDQRVLAALLRYLAIHNLGRRFTLAGNAAPAVEWKHPGLRFEQVELSTAPALEMPVEGRVFSKSNPAGVYRVPRVLRECDKVISVAPFAVHPTAGVALSVMNYLGFAPAAHYGDEGEEAMDLFSFHPADYAIVGGAERHNVLIAGTNAVAVDAVGAAVLGLDPLKIRHLDLAVKHGYGINDADAIWTRGAEIGEVKVKSAATR
jgi:hypothetical protein